MFSTLAAVRDSDVKDYGIGRTEKPSRTESACHLSVIVLEIVVYPEAVIMVKFGQITEFSEKSATRASNAVSLSPIVFSRTVWHTELLIFLPV